MPYPLFIGPLTASQFDNSRYGSEEAVRIVLYRYFILGHRDF